MEKEHQKLGIIISYTILKLQMIISEFRKKWTDFGSSINTGSRGLIRTSWRSSLWFPVFPSKQRIYFSLR